MPPTFTPSTSCCTGSINCASASTATTINGVTYCCPSYTQFNTVGFSTCTCPGQQTCYNTFPPTSVPSTYTPTTSPPQAVATGTLATNGTTGSTTSPTAATVSGVYTTIIDSSKVNDRYIACSVLYNLLMHACPYIINAN